MAADVWSVTSYKELYRDANDCERWNMLHPGETAKVPFVTQTLERRVRALHCRIGLHEGPAGIAGEVDSRPTGFAGHRWLRPQRKSGLHLRDFFEVDAKHIVLATLGALVREKKIAVDVMKKAIVDLGIDPEKLNPAIS